MPIPQMTLGQITPAVNQAPAFKYGPGPLEQNESVAKTGLLNTQAEELPKETAINQQNANTNEFKANTDLLDAKTKQADLMQKQVEFQHKTVSNMCQNWLTAHADDPASPAALQDFETLRSFVSPLLGDDLLPKDIDPIRAKYLPSTISTVASMANDVKDQITQNTDKLKAQTEQYKTQGMKYELDSQGRPVGNPILDTQTGKPMITEERRYHEDQIATERARIAMEANKAAVAKTMSEKDDEKMGMQLAKQISGLSSGSKSALGIAQIVNMRANRALMVLDTPNATVEDKNMAVMDLQSIMQGGAPFAEEVKKGMYGSALEDAKKAFQYATATPTAYKNPAVINKLRQTILDLKEIDNKIIDDNIGIFAAGAEGWATRHPDQWSRLTGAVEKTTEVPSLEKNRQTNQGVKNMPSPSKLKLAREALNDPKASPEVKKKAQEIINQAGGK